MARSANTDPLRNFKFQVSIYPSGAGLAQHVGNEIGNLGFTVVSGLTVQHEMIAYREGGMNTHPHKMIGQTDYGPVTFSKGVFGHEKSLWAWHTFLHSWSQGGQDGGSSSLDNDYRADIIVKVFDHPVSSGSYATAGDTATASTPAGRVKFAYKLYNCWPASYSLTDLNAGDSSIMIQQMVMNHEGFDLAFSNGRDGAVPNDQLTIG
jgi:phage tail-like protein